MLRPVLEIMALTCAALAALASWLEFGAVGVVANVTLLAEVAAVISIASLVTLQRLPPPRWNRARMASAVSFVIASIALGIAVWREHLSIRREEVPFGHGAIRISGTLYLPRTAGPYPAAVLVHGSGAESRKEYSYYAKHFARHGIAALVYDKRGVGRTSGELRGTDYTGYADDALAGIAALKARSDIAARHIGMVGWSEAEWVIPQAAVRSTDVGFVIVMSASGLSPARQVAAEMEIRLRRKGFGDSVVNRALAVNESLYMYQRTGLGADSLRVLLERSSSEPWFSVAEKLPAEVYPAADYAWWRSVMDYNALENWRRVRVPVLLVRGGRDARSNARLARDNIVGALQAGGNTSVKAIIYPKADHGVVEWPLGDNVPPPRFPDGYLDELTSWIDMVVRNSR